MCLRSTDFLHCLHCSDDNSDNFLVIFYPILLNVIHFQIRLGSYNHNQFSIQFWLRHFTRACKELSLANTIQKNSNGVSNIHWLTFGAKLELLPWPLGCFLEKMLMLNVSTSPRVHSNMRNVEMLICCNQW